MHTFNIEDAAFSGVGLLARKPVAALIWAVLWVGLVAIVTMPFLNVIANFVTLIARGGEVNPNEMLPILPGLGAFFLLSSILGVALGAVISCAVYRAYYFPEQSMFAYLRLGDAEIQVLLSNFAKATILFVASLGMSMVLAVILTLTGQPLSSADASPLGLFGRLVIQCVIWWLQLRLCMSGPMTFMHVRFRLFESWSLTREQALRLLVVGVLLALIVLVVYLALSTLGLGVGYVIWNSMPRPADVQDLLKQSPSEWFAPLAPFIALSGFLVLIGGAILTPITTAPWAYIYRVLESRAHSVETDN
jgi:hypothetical protein